MAYTTLELTQCNVLGDKKNIMKQINYAENKN